MYSTNTAKCVGVILVTFLLSYSLYLILPQTYTVYLGLHVYGFHLGLYRNPYNVITSDWSEAQSREITLIGIVGEF